MLNAKLIYKVLGSLLFIEAFMMAVCLVTAVCSGGDDILAFAVTVAVVIVIAATLRYTGREADSTMGLRDAFMLVTVAWVVFSFFGSLPFLISGHIKTFTDAYFETMAGFTTTGASVIDDLEAFPCGLLLWRSIMQWLGGLGIVFFTIAVLPTLVEGSLRVYSAEGSSSIKTRVHPRLGTTARWILTIYLSLNVACAAVYYALGMDVFDSVNHAMTTISTGGFATHNESIAYFNSPGIDRAAIVFMCLGSISFTLLYMAVFKGKVKDLLTSSELRLFFLMIVACTAAVAAFLIVDGGYSIGGAVHSALFQVTAFITSTGFSTEDAGDWPHLTWGVLSLCMIVGGCAGSTSGGIKCMRVLTVLKIVGNEFTKKLHPRAVLPVRVNGTNIAGQQQVTIIAFIALYVLMCVVVSFFLAMLGVAPANALTMSLCCAGNVGSAVGPDISNTMSWSPLPMAAKWACTALMLVGRLEIFNVLVLFTTAFWKGD